MKLTESKLRKIIGDEIKTVIAESSQAFLIVEDENASPEQDKAVKNPSAAIKDLNVGAGPSATVQWLNSAGADPRVRALLNSGKKDGSEEDEAAKVTEGSATIGKLVPTQVEIELTKSIAYPLANFGSLKKMISGGVQRIGPAGNDMIVKSGNLIVDGHHRWSSLFSVAGPAGIIASIDIELPEKDAASVLAIVQTAIAATLDGPVPKAKAGGMNILGQSKDAIAKMIRSAYEQGEGEAGPILADDFISECLADPMVSKHFGIDVIRKEFGISTVPEDKERAETSSAKTESLLREKPESGSANRKAIARARAVIIDKVAQNLSQMKQPAKGAPPRVDMPQLDKADGGVQGVMDKLASGDVNYKPPFGQLQAAGYKPEGTVIVERWQKIAGLIK